MKKSFLFFSFFIFHSSLVLAQDTTSKILPKINRAGLININAGVGLSLFPWAANGYPIGGGQFNTLTQIPACNFTIDYLVTNHFSLGVGCAYQSLTDNPNIDAFGTDYATWESERITRYNASLRILVHFNAKPRFDVYCGGRPGVSIWTDDIISFNKGDYSNPPRLTTNPNYRVKPSIQLLFGLIYCLTPHIGLHIEAGIGTPYFIEAGITFKINTKKIK